MASRTSIGQALRALGRPVFTTREVAAVRGGSIAATSRSLARLEGEGRVVRARRGVWCDPEDPAFTPFALVHFLAGTHPAYVSFVSALHLHGLVEQIPQVIYAATTGHTARRRTPIATYSFHRIDPRFFDGFDWYRGGNDFLIAEPEKALIDSLYLASRKGKRFGRFPELDLGPGFRFERAEEWIERIPYQHIRHFVARRFQELNKRQKAADLRVHERKRTAGSTLSSGEILKHRDADRR